MKKVTMIISIFIFLCALSLSVAEDEISFQNIPWLSESGDVLNMLNERGLIYSLEHIEHISTENSLYITKDESTNYRPNINPDYAKVCYSISLSGNTRGKIAGWPIEDIILTFAYDGEYRLIAIRIKLINADYSLLKEKLNIVYENGIGNVNDDDIESVYWTGANNSAILLYTESEGYEFTLMYGRLDAEEILESCVISSDPDDVTGL